MDIGELELQIKSESKAASAGLDSLKNSLSELKAVTKGGTGLAKVGTDLQKISKAIGSLDTSGLRKLKEISDALSEFKMVDTKSFSSVTRVMKKFPEVLKSLNKVDTNKLKKRIRAVADAMKPLALEMDMVAKGFSSFPTKLQKFMNAADAVPAQNQKMEKSFGHTAFRIGAMGYVLHRVAGVVADWITESNKYIENLNLFTASLGRFAGQAQNYAESVGEIMGIDPGEWMRNQGVFMTLATGFGVVEDRAYTMSKNLTQLGYDLSSFFNVSVQDAMQKLQSGLAGELEPLRRFGYDLSQAKLEAIALSLGIDKSYRSMTQAEKSQLRYYAILTQVTTAQGDMARTLDAPANQLRILQAQVTQAARALGNVFIPILNQVLPYAIAGAKAIRILADSFARFVGFELPEVDYSGLGGLEEGVGGVEDKLEDATGAAAELKKMLLGIDELNVMPSKQSGPSGVGGSGGGGFDFDLPEYDFIGQAIEQKADALVDDMVEALKIVGMIGAGIAAWKLSQGVMDFFNAVKMNGGRFGITLVVAGIALESHGIMNSIREGLNNINFSEIIAGAGGITIGGALIGETLGSAMIGGAIGGIVAGIPAFATGVYHSFKNGISPLSAALTTGAATLAGAAVGAFFGPIGSGIGAFTGLIVGTLTNAGIFIYQYWDEIKLYFTGVWTGMKENFEGIGEDLVNFWPRVGDGIMDGLDAIGLKLEGWWDEIKIWWTGLVLPSLHIKTPHISWGSIPAQGWIKNTLEFFKLPTSLPTMNIQWYKNGGFPDAGEMFVAREAGPEMVGSIGGRTAVANNDQIVAAVSAGVYSAVRDAMRETSGSQHTTVSIDGNALFDFVVSKNREQAIMTGSSPMEVY